MILCSLGKLWWNVADQPVLGELEVLRNNQPMDLSQSGGLKYFSADIYHEISYPIQALNHCIVGCAKVRFGVYESGAMTQVVVSKGLGYGIDEELLRAFQNCRIKTLPSAPKDQISKVFEVTIGFTINGAPRLKNSPVLLINSKTVRTCLTEHEKL